eukprot:205314-Pleurochrysis_carterae.AAC.3
MDCRGMLWQRDRLHWHVMPRFSIVISVVVAAAAAVVVVGAVVVVVIVVEVVVISARARGGCLHENADTDEDDDRSCLKARLARGESKRHLGCIAESPLKGLTRFESIVRTNSMKPRTPELACSTITLILYGIYQSYHPDRVETTHSYTIQRVAGWELARARGLRRVCTVASVGDVI